jgi:hypothetical protein
MSRAKMEAASELIKEKRYTEARVIRFCRKNWRYLEKRRRGSGELNVKQPIQTSYRSSEPGRECRPC